MAIIIEYRADISQPLRSLTRLRRAQSTFARNAPVGGALARTTGQVTQQARQATEQVRQLGRQSQQVDRLTRSTQQSARSMGTLRGAALGAAAVLGGRAFIGASDALVSIQNRLRTVTDGSADLISTQRELEAIGRRTRTELAPLAELYQKISQNSDLTVTSQRDLFTEVEGLSAALASTGTSATAAAAAITQYTQGVGLGKFETEELKTLLEQSAPVANALGREFNATRPELLKMAEAGELTADRVRRAVRSLSGLSAGISQLPIESGRAFGLLRQEVGLLVGEFSQAVGAGSGLSGLLQRLTQGVTVLRDRMPQVIQAVTILGTAVGVTLATQLAIATARFVQLRVAAIATFVTTMATAGARALAFVTSLSAMSAALARVTALVATLGIRLLTFVAIPVAAAAAFVVFQNDAIAAFRAVRDNIGAFGELAVNLMARTAIRIRLLFLTMARAVAGAFGDLANTVIDTINGLIAQIDGSVIGQVLRDQLGIAFDQIGQVDTTSGFDTLIDGMQQRLQGLEAAGESAASALSNAFNTELAKTPELIDTITSQLSEYVDRNPTLKRFIDALTGNIDLSLPEINIAGTQGGGAGGGSSSGSSSSDAGTVRATRFDSRLDQASSALGDFSSLIRNETLSTVSTFFRTLQTVNRATQTLFGPQGLFANRTPQAATGAAGAGAAGQVLNNEATNRLTTAVAQGTQAQTQGNFIQRALSTVTNALGITQQASSATAAATSAANTTATAALTAALALNTTAVTANTLALSAQQARDTGSTIVRAFTTAQTGGFAHYKRGTVSVPGSGRGDKIPALLEPGELVTPNRTNDQLAILEALESKFGASNGPQIQVNGDVNRQTVRELRRLVNDGTLTGMLNQRNIENGGAGLFK